MRYQESTLPLKNKEVQDSRLKWEVYCFYTGCFHKKSRCLNFSSNDCTWGRLRMLKTFIAMSIIPIFANHKPNVLITSPL